MLNFLPIREWIYLAAIMALAAGFGIFVHHERTIGAQHELTVVTAASNKAKAEAQKTIDAINSQHEADITAIESSYANSLKAAAYQHDSDLKRLRDYEARNRSSNPVLGSSSSSPTSADAGASGIDPMGQAALALADALRQDDSALTECWRERDSLTGK